MLIIKIIENSKMYNTQELYLHFVKLILTKLVFLIFLVHSSTSLLTIFLCIYNFYNQDIHQHHMIYHIHIHNN